MVTPLSAGARPLFAGVMCTGSSTVDVLALGSELLWGLWASLVSGGVGGLSDGPKDLRGIASGASSVQGGLRRVGAASEWLSTRSNRCSFFSTWAGQQAATEHLQCGLPE